MLLVEESTIDWSKYGSQIRFITDIFKHTFKAMPLSTLISDCTTYIHDRLSSDILRVNSLKLLSHIPLLSPESSDPFLPLDRV